MIRAEMISCCEHGRVIWIGAQGRECSYGPRRAPTGSLWDFAADTDSELQGARLLCERLSVCGNLKRQVTAEFWVAVQVVFKMGFIIIVVTHRKNVRLSSIFKWLNEMGAVPFADVSTDSLGTCRSGSGWLLDSALGVRWSSKSEELLLWCWFIKSNIWCFFFSCAEYRFRGGPRRACCGGSSHCCLQCCMYIWCTRHQDQMIPFSAPVWCTQCRDFHCCRPCNHAAWCVSLSLNGLRDGRVKIKDSG